MAGRAKFAEFLMQENDTRSKDLLSTHRKDVV